MNQTPDILKDFTALFGNQPDGCDRGRVTHCQESPRIVTLCRAAMAEAAPALYQYFQAWDSSADTLNPLALSHLLAVNGRREAAWSLACLYVDQVAKQEAATGQRVPNKGHPVCNVALVGVALGSPALVRHYGSLSSAGDFYAPGAAPAAPHGLGPVLMEPHESRKRHEVWRELVGKQVASVDPKQPLHLEAYLAARWFRGKYQESITKLAPVAKGDTRTFVEVLLDEVVNWADDKNTTGQGTLFEAAAGLLLSATPGFTVYPCRWNKDDQIDLVVRYEPDSLAPPCLPLGYGLVECKAVEGAVDSATLRAFGMNCLLHKVQFGILVSRARITGGGVRFKDPTGAELTRRRFLGDGLTLLVLDISQLRGQDRELRGLHDALFDDYQRLVFGHIMGEE